MSVVRVEPPRDIEIVMVRHVFVHVAVLLRGAAGRALQLESPVTIDWSRLSVPIVFAITVSYGRCHDLATWACAPRWKTYGLSGASRSPFDQVIDRGLVGEVGEMHGQPIAEVRDVVQRPLDVARTNACTFAPSSTSASVRCEPMTRPRQHWPAPVDVAEGSRWSASRSAGSSRVAHRAAKRVSGSVESEP